MSPASQNLAPHALGQIPAPAPAPPPISAEAWRECLGAAPLRPLSEVVDRRARLVVVSAHPDDETIGAGRLIADHPGEVAVVTFSAGERCVVHPDLDPRQLAQRRLDEWRDALAALAATALEAPLFPDGALAEHEEQIYDALTVALQPGDVVVSLWPHDPHPDHQAVGRAASRAADHAQLPLLNYPVWATYWLEPAELVARGTRVLRVATSPAADQARQQALSAFASQLQPLSPTWPAVVPAELLQRHDQQLLFMSGGALPCP